MESFQSGEVLDNAASINVELGWVPDYVEVTNVTDGDIISCGFPNRQIIPFSGGGVNELVVGEKITDVTTKATAIIKEVLLYSGSWAGGDAAGFFVAEVDDIVGTFGSNNVTGETAAATDDATVTVQVTHTVSIEALVATKTTTDALLPYAGVDSTNAKGFIIGSLVAEEAKLLRWCAWRNDR